jgi:hypothetical protein
MKIIECKLTDDDVLVFSDSTKIKIGSDIVRTVEELRKNILRQLEKKQKIKQCFSVLLGAQIKVEISIYKNKGTIYEYGIVNMLHQTNVVDQILIKSIER